jgi:rieske iron-sulfur protein
MTRTAVSRRIVLGGCLSAPIAGTAFPTSAQTPPDPERAKLPQPGDLLVAAEAEPGTTPLKPADVGSDDVTFAWAFDPQKKVPRDGSRLNMVLLMRFDPAKLGPAEKPRAAQGVVAYSAICTHQQCPVADWLQTAQVLQCPCHQSRYDLLHGAKVVGGPAPRPLPALPLKLNGGALEVAAPFTDRVGGEQPQSG